MQQSRSIQNIRRIAMMIGFALFVLCIYKASHEIASPKIAAGVQHTQVVKDNSNVLAQLGAKTSSYNLPAFATPVAAEVSSDHVSSTPTTNLAELSKPPVVESSKKQAKSEGVIKVTKQVTSPQSNKLHE